MTQVFKTVDNEYAYDVVVALEKLRDQGLRYVGNIVCEGHQTVLILEEEPHTTITFASEYPAVKVIPEGAMTEWSQNQPIPDMLIFQNSIPEDTS